ncbi:MAG: response regulator [Bdellovibrionaceae bacterium]|nr:response regulator [Pseudobdellovibrionaceae bacterium]
MERSYSLYHFLMSRFGTYFGIVLLLGSCLIYARENTTKEDLQNVSLLQETRYRIDQASKSSVQYLKHGKSKELDEYNSHIVQMGKRFSELATNLKKIPEMQEQFADVQKKTRVHFLDINAKLEKKQNGRFDVERGLASLNETPEVLASLDAMTASIRERTSQPVTFLGVSGPLAVWEFMFGLFAACFCILTSQSFQRVVNDDYKKDVSELKIQSILLDGILNSISEALIVIDEKGNITRYNTAAQRIIGNRLRRISTDDDAREVGFFDVNTMQPLGLQELPFARALRGEQVEDLEILVHNESHPQGMYISISSRYLSDIDGGIRGGLVVFRDISRRKATEQEWLRARESAIETARKKSDFLAAMSHEIRTPMNGVMGMSTLLAETDLSSEQKDYVGTIKRSAEALLRLINDILDHSKIEAGKVEINLRPFDLRVLCDDVLELFYPTVREKNINLDIQWKGRDEWYFVSDPERLRQIMVNLIGNAVKFTEAGGVRVIVESIGPGIAKSKIRVSVIDSGAGMSEEESQFLFQKYFQTKSGMKYGGTGLGLSICHQLVELMGGKIGLKSEPGMGATFWFELDLAISTASEIPAQTEHHFAAIFSGKVLLAEDQLVNQRVATIYLQKLGLEVDVAANGQIAVEKALKNSYDLIFMDCQMPVMTGYDATRKIREIQVSERTPIVALTAEGTSGEKKSCLAVGMDDFLTKPLELERLTEVLHRWLKTSVQVIDPAALEKLKSYVVNNKSLTEALIEDFMSTAPGLVAQMKSAHALEDIKFAAHALKSSSATLGATGLAELCKKIEDAVDLVSTSSHIEQLDDYLSKSSEELQKYTRRKAA